MRNLFGRVLVGLKRAALRIPFAKRLKRETQDLLFDLRFHVGSAGDQQVDKLHVVGENAPHAILYAGTGLRMGRMILASLPIQDFSKYTFVDFGSGKGRMLLIAAEYPFRKIVGVEFATELHATASQNIKTYRNPRRKCLDLVSLNMDALSFPVPATDCVIYFHFPFRRPVMQPLLERINDSLDRNPRDVIIAFLNPEIGSLLEETRHFRVFSEHRYFKIYRNSQ